MNAIEGGGGGGGGGTTEIDQELAYAHGTYGGRSTVPYVLYVQCLCMSIVMISGSR